MYLSEEQAELYVSALDLTGYRSMTRSLYFRQIYITHAKMRLNVILRLTLRRMLAESFEFKFLCKNVAFVVEYNAFVYNF